MTIAMIRDALHLPSKADVDRRIPKNAFMEQMKGATDRKAFDAVVERLDWCATLSPGSVGVSAWTSEDSSVHELQLLALTARKEPPPRLLHVIHSTIPHPVMLVSQWPDGGLAVSWLARFQADRGLFTVNLPPSALPHAFLASLDLACLPRTDLAALYLGLIERGQALWAAQISGGAFRLPANADDAVQRVQALANYTEAEAHYRRIKSAAAREKRLAHAVELGNKARQAKIALDHAIKALL